MSINDDKPVFDRCKIGNQINLEKKHLNIVFQDFTEQDSELEFYKSQKNLHKELEEDFD